MVRSRLTRVRSKRETRQGIFYLVLAIFAAVAMLVWGLPALSQLAGVFMNPNTPTSQSYTIKPTPPIFTDVPTATNSATVSLSGFSQPGVTVELYVNGAKVNQVLTSDSSTFTFPSITLSSGDNEIYAYASSLHGVLSDQSQSYTISFDTTKPQVTITSPHDGDTMTGQSQQLVTFQGSVDKAGAKVYIGDHMVILNPDNTFSFQYQLTQGSQQIAIKAIDGAGNESDSTMTLTWNP